MTHEDLRRLGGACHCGTHVLHRYGGSGRLDVWACCCPWLDEEADEIVGYGWDMRSDRKAPPALRRGREPCKPPTPRLDHPLLHQIGVAPAGMTSCVYERFDADGIFLYVGVSDAPLQRAKIHLKRSTWFLFAASGRELWFPSRAQAERVERDVIETRRPLFNRLHARPEAYEALIRYLVDKGRFDLLEVKATWG